MDENAVNNENSENTENSRGPEQDANPQEVFDQLQKELRLRDLEAKVADYESKIGDIRSYVKKMEEEISAMRQRFQRDALREVDQKVGDFFLKLLPIVDDFERSLKSAEGDQSSLAQGVRLIAQHLQDFLKKNGLNRLSAKGEPFEPESHEAIAQLPVEKESEAGKIIEEVTPGYKYKDKILRPAKVVVGAPRES